MRTDDFEKNYPDETAKVRPETLRTWRKRGSVPEGALQTLGIGVSSPPTVSETVSETVSSPPAVSNPEDSPWDIMPDGWARGFPGDTALMRAWYRTPGAVRRQIEAEGGTVGEQQSKIKARIAELGPVGKVVNSR